MDSFNISETRELYQFFFNDEATADNFYNDSYQLEFNELLTKYSQSKQQSYLGSVGKDEILDFEVADAAYNMIEGEFGEPIDGMLGISVLYLEKINPGKIPTVDDVAAEIRSEIQIQEAIDLAGGLTELATADNIVISQEFTNIDLDGNETSLTENVANAPLNFELSQNSVINIIPFENVVSVEGNVYNPGLVAFEKGMTMSKAIIQAGGYKPYSLKKRSYVKRANGEIDKANLFRGRTKRLLPGDTVFVPENPEIKFQNSKAILSEIKLRLNRGI